MNKTLTKDQEAMVDEWIHEMSEAGYTPEQMLLILKEARRQYDNYYNKKNAPKTAENVLPHEQGS